ncbi:hypothetical protein Tsubulata_010924 [Turnera subulata]|uniref:Uncharacterized protein n=1 Tax=Turnera subulata TaxID=218843 RepID=A0A9Q0J164_9ROSI|nr:hypothetical protein Tsubulata_010924 [Turnera subulata]
MATLPASQSLKLPFPLKLHAIRPRTQFSFTIRAAGDNNTTEPDSSSDPKPGDSDQFESRLSEVRLRYKMGTGKKAQMKKSKKAARTGSGSGVYLPPVALKQPVADGLKVEFGFSPYSERVNGRIAMLGLAALLLVELATGKSVINYHTPAIVFIQVYFVAAVAALYVKYEKEKVSVWPKSAPAKE